MCLSIAVEYPGNVLSRGKHLEYEWMTIHNGMGYRCGYIRLPLGHPWHSMNFADIPASVHGGLSFAEHDVPCDAPGPDTDWWIGFDCGHAFDLPDPDLHAGAYMTYARMSPLYHKYEVRSQQYVEDECLKLCEQAAAAMQQHLDSDLSPAARGVLAAMTRSFDHEPTRRAIAVSILRFLADHERVPAVLGGPIDHWDPDPRTRRELRAIANELEAEPTATTEW